MHKRHSESGAVSLFLVIFAMLLITVITLSFIRIMVQDQNASSVNDLSQSAYDSAQAGTEDAKRELIYYRTVCATGNSAACTNVRNTVNSTTCNQGLKDVVAVPADGEVPVQQTQSSNDVQLNQAYTCVKMSLDTADYVGSVDANTSKMIPLTATNNFSSVNIQWYSAEDIGSTSTAVNLVANTPSQKILYLKANWPANRPSLLRTQLMQYGSTFKLSDFDSSNTTNSNTNTLFLYPTRTGLGGSLDFTRDIRKTAAGDTQPVQCSATLSSGGYACSTTLNLPKAIGQPDASRTAYLRLTALYNATHFRISFNDPSVKFSGVQPSIDSTGRANDQYRRIETRVDLVSTDFAFPEAAVDITGNLCKNFSITDVANDYSNTSTCTP